MSTPNSLPTLLLLIPTLGALLLVLIPPSRHTLIWCWGLTVTLVTFLLSVFMAVQFDAAQSEMQFLQNFAWFEVAGFQVRYQVGVDGLSLFLVVLTTFLMPPAVLASWTIQEKRRSYLFLLLLLETGMIGVFVSIDLVLFYVFWEVMLIPMYFLIGVWGGERRIYAAVKFFIYTTAASLLMLAGIITLAILNQGRCFDLLEITEKLAGGRIVLSSETELLLFLAFFLAFAVKIPLVPFHTWLPDAHVEAPTAGSVILAGVLLKMGTYGLLRFCLPMFPRATHTLAPLISILAVIGIIYGALLALVQPDIKKLVAYSSISHLGFVVLGIFSFNLTALEGATYQMLNHGLSTGALFLLVGMLYDRRHTHLIGDFGGLAQVIPRHAAFFMFILLSSIGLPGLNGFVGEFLVLQGTFLKSSTQAAWAGLGVILSAVYMLWMYQRVFLGSVNREENRRLPDLSRREAAILLPIVLMALWMGVYSGNFLRRMDASLQKIVNRVEQTQVYRVEFREH